MTRTQLIQALINKFRYKSYLEIGCRDDANYAHIHASHKVGVDPASGGTHRMTSDDFFASNTQKFDIIFIDGLHISDQVDKDIQNSLKFLNDNGCIVLQKIAQERCHAFRLAYELRPSLDFQYNGEVSLRKLRRL